MEELDGEVVVVDERSVLADAEEDEDEEALSCLSRCCCCCCDSPPFATLTVMERRTERAGEGEVDVDPGMEGDTSGESGVWTGRSSTGESRSALSECDGGTEDESSDVPLLVAGSWVCAGTRWACELDRDCEDGVGL